MSTKRPLKSLFLRTIFFLLRSLQLILTIVLIALVAHLITLYKSSPAPSSSSIDLSLLLFGSNTTSTIPAELIASIFIASIVTLYLLITFLVICFAHRSLFVAMMVVDFLALAGMVAVAACLRRGDAPGGRICEVEELVGAGVLQRRGWQEVGNGYGLAGWRDCQVVKAGFGIAVVEAASFILSLCMSWGLWKMHVQPEEQIYQRRHSKASYRSSLESHPRRSGEA